MNPKKPKDFKEGIAEEVGVHQKVVDDFVKFYYSKVRSALSNLEYPRINVEGLGTFVIRKRKLDAQINRHKSILGNIVNTTYNGYEKSVAVKRKIELLENMKKMNDERIEAKKKFKNYE